MAGKKSGDGAKGADDKCPLCKKGKLTDKKHTKKIPEDGTNKRDGNFRGYVLGCIDVRTHTLYEKGNPPQAHHLISVSAMEDFGPHCKAIGYNINCKENCVFLPSSREKACQYVIQYHQGGHMQTYYMKVNLLVKGIFNGFDENECEDNESKKQTYIDNLHAKSREILGKIQNFGLLLQTDSLNYMAGNILGCSQLVKAGEKEKTDDLSVKTTIKEIEQKREQGKKRFSMFMDKKFSDSNVNSDEQLKKIKEKVSCKCGRNHGFVPLIYALTVGNIH